MASVGEPLNPEAVVWGVEAFGKPFHDNWWQTETGGIMISNYLAMDVKPGSMGRPLPGITAGIVEHLEDGQVREVTKPMVMGELALRPGWPSMMRWTASAASVSMPRIWMASACAPPPS
jgi:acetyl-CoA synthetase